MRGKLIAVKANQTGHRITPARAGKTLKVPVRHLAAEDHPRACGENAAQAGTIPRVKGSPPRVRGKQLYALDARQKSRITPARAGKTEIC